MLLEQRTATMKTWIRRKARWTGRKLGLVPKRPSAVPLPEAGADDARDSFGPTLASIHLQDGREWNDDEIDRLRWTLVGWRDRGHIDQAVEGLLAAGRRWPRHPQFLLELLIIQSIRPDLTLPEATTVWPRETLDYPEVALFLGLQAASKGDLGEAGRRLALVEAIDPQRLEPFRPHYVELLRLVRLDPARTAYVMVAKTSPEPLNTPEGQALIAVLVELLIHADSHGDLINLTRACMYFGTLEVPDHAHVVLAAMDAARPRLSLEGRVVHLELILATFRAEGAVDLVGEILADDASRHSARFARTAALVAARLKDGALEREILTRFVPPDAPRSPLEAAQIAEIQGRRAALRLDRPLNVLVGFFGQMREPEAVLPQAVEALIRIFGEGRHGAFQPHFALSTWPRTGGRTLGLDETAGFFAQAAPPEVRDLLMGRHGANGRALAQHLPHLIDTLVQHHSARAARQTTPQELRSYLPAGAAVVTTAEADVEAEIRPALARIGRDHPATVNQFKMWSRIAALRAPLSDLETTLGRPVDLCLLLRCDLAGLDGSLTELAARAVSPYEASSIFYDYDAHAEFIEGSGDRYMFGSRNSIQALLNGYDHYLATVRAEPVGVLAERLTAHSGVQSLIVMNGLVPAPVWALRYELHRGAPPTDVVRRALKADHDAAVDPDLRAEIAAALDRLAAPPNTEAP